MAYVTKVVTEFLAQRFSELNDELSKNFCKVYDKNPKVIASAVMATVHYVVLNIDEVLDKKKDLKEVVGLDKKTMEKIARYIR